MKLLTKGSASTKIAKSDNSDLGYLSAILYLLPHKLSGNNVCPSSSKGCRDHCLNYSGRGYMYPVIAGRKRKTRLFFDNRPQFLELLHSDIKTFGRKAEKHNLKPAIRLNGLSDLPWESLDKTLFSDHPEIQFYDYTKIYNRMLKYLDGNMPANYHLTFSRHENNEDKCLSVLELGGSVAVVFPSKILPKQWKNHKVFNGDTTDLRFLDPKAVIGLYAKGRAKRDDSGFVYKEAL